MTTVPPEIAETIPLADPTIATPGSELDQVPPVNKSDRSVPDPAQAVKMPLIAEGIASTVTTAVVLQPLINVYLTVAVPNPLPKYMPEAVSMRAIEVSELIHVPPAGVSVSDVYNPLQTLRWPPMAPGATSTVTVAIALHPVAKIVYVIVAVPEACPVTMPVPRPTVATKTSELPHVPPMVVSVIDVVKPGHICMIPKIADGSGLTVT